MTVQKQQQKQQRHTKKPNKTKQTWVILEVCIYRGARELQWISKTCIEAGNVIFREREKRKTLILARFSPLLSSQFFFFIYIYFYGISTKWVGRCTIVMTWEDRVLFPVQLPGATSSQMKNYFYIKTNWELFRNLVRFLLLDKLWRHSCAWIVERNLSVCLSVSCLCLAWAHFQPVSLNLYHMDLLDEQAEVKTM